jgi:hypothetical protein
MTALDCGGAIGAASAKADIASTANTAPKALTSVINFQLDLPSIEFDSRQKP